MTGIRDPREVVREGRRALLRELYALLLVYAALAVLPILTGFACQS